MTAKSLGLIFLVSFLSTPFAQSLTVNEILQGRDNINGQVLGASTPVHVQTAGASTPGDITVSVPLTATALGNLLAVGVYSSNGLPTSITDNKGDVFSTVNSMTDPSGASMALYYAKNITAGATSVTVNAPYGQLDAIVSEYSGLDTAAPLDQNQKFDNGFNTGSTFTSGTATTTQANELLWGFATEVSTNIATWTPGAGWNARKNQNHSFVEDQSAAAAGSFAVTGSFSPSANYHVWAALATFKGAGAASGSAPVISSFSASPATVAAGSPSTLSWTVTGSPAPTLSITGIGAVTGSSVSVSPTTTTVYTLAATNSIGTTSAQATVTVTGGGTSTPPSAPTALTGTPVSSSQINLSWTAPVPGSNPIASYQVFRGTQQIATPAATAYSDTGLAASTAYTYSVKAVDTTGLASAASSSVSVTTPAAPAAGPPGPVLFFSDLIWGPKSGWEGSATKGAAVTVWGKNFGTARGSNFITVNGTNLVSNTDYAEWGASGPARGLERITFWLNSSAQDGAGNITITVNGRTSNALPFTVAPGTIYFISVTDGNNNNSGLYSTAQGGSNGPFKDLCMFNPGVASQDGVTTCHNPSGDGQYIAYVRGGTYTATESSANPVAFINLRGPYGGPTKQKALIGYPGETPVLNNSAAQGIVWEANYAPYGANNYFTFAKLTSAGSNVGYTEPFPIIWGSYNRIIGNTLSSYTGYDQAGLIGVFDAQHTSIYGNWFDKSGNDSFKHYIYIKTQGMVGYDATYNQNTWYTDVGWNEMSNAIASDNGGGVIFVSHEGSATVLNYTTDYVYVHDNYFHDGNMEFFYIGDGTPLGMIGKNIYLYNNIFKGGTSNNGGMTIYDGADTVNLFNNTFYQTNGTGAAQTGMFTQTGNTRTILKNNIWYTKTGMPYFYLETFKGATLNSDHDLFFNNATLPGDSGMTVAASKTGDPLFTNIAANDFSLQSASPAIGAGSTAVNAQVTTDYLGKTRPSNAYSIGAFDVSAGTAPPPDTTAPSTPAGLTAAAVSTSQINLAWAAASDPDNQASQLSYKVFRNGTQLAVIPAGITAYQDTGLSSSTTYSYTVSAQDPAGNSSAQSASASATTQAILPVISNLVGSNTTATSTQISWTTNVPTNGQVFFGLTSAYGSQTALIDDNSKTSSHTVVLSNLSPSTLYHFQAKSIDAFGNNTSSADFTFTTLAAPPVSALVIYSFAATPNGITSGSSAALSWTVSGSPTSLSIDNSIGSVLGLTSKTVSPTVPTTYTLTATNSGGIATAQVTINVSNPIVVPTATAPAITSFIASSSTVTSGQSVTLSWQVTGSPTATISLSGSGTQSGNSTVVNPARTTTYTLTATNTAGSATAQITVAVNTAPASSGGGGGGGGIAAAPVVYIPPVVIPTSVPTPPTPAPRVGQPSGSRVSAYSPNTLVNDKGTIYFIAANRVKIPFTSMKAFRGLGYSLRNVIAGNTSGYIMAQKFFLSSPFQEHPWGSWVKKGRSKAIYYFAADGLIAVPSWDVFLSNGGQAKFIVPMSRADLAKLRVKRKVLPLTANDPRVSP